MDLEIGQPVMYGGKEYKIERFVDARVVMIREGDRVVVKRDDIGPIHERRNIEPGEPDGMCS